MSWRSWIGWFERAKPALIGSSEAGWVTSPSRSNKASALVCASTCFKQEGWASTAQNTSVLSVRKMVELKKRFDDIPRRLQSVLEIHQDAIRFYHASNLRGIAAWIEMAKPEGVNCRVLAENDQLINLDDERLVSLPSSYPAPDLSIFESLRGRKQIQQGSTRKRSSG